MLIAVYGLGYVGLTAALCLASEGHKIIGVDISDQKVGQIMKGASPIEEPGLDKLLSDALEKNLLSCTTDPAAPIASCEMAIVCVGTPSGADGSHNMRDIAEVSRQIALAFQQSGRTEKLTVVYRSTIRPGTIEELIHPIFKSVLDEAVDHIELVYNPEFLREAMAIKDFFNPPKIVIGTADGLPNARMDEINRNLTAPVFYLPYREFEFTKFVDNSFHALKVAFANEIGRICLNLEISPSAIYKIFISDTKLNISPYYFRPGGPFGGSCLPKDVRALQYIANDVGANTHVVDALMRSNDAHKHFLFQRAIAGLAPGAKVLMLGLAFKSNTDDLRESPNIDLARKLLQAGYALSILDPSLNPHKLIGQNLGYAFSHLPGLTKLLVSAEVAETQEFDVVIDTNGSSKNLSFRSSRILDFYTL